jgi:hypothetical protein
MTPINNPSIGEASAHCIGGLLHFSLAYVDCGEWRHLVVFRLPNHPAFNRSHDK